MKHEISVLLVDALRSGKYEQGKRCLNDEGKFCCLGVLCDISKLSEWKLDDFNRYLYLNKSATLPFEIQEWAGIKTSRGYYSANESLSGVNDKGKTFSEIADIIEQNWQLI